ncbi:hypothetical protein Thein_2066 [Thermodesulfatator indicus DSM 15286]|uniref:Transmembrane protein n=1 Tax=Thermodesulfatator indicus (strain DSM 15286 / JCM 11887 / CIR29812) TaxID=667014 RepID=F8A9S9_THEID|nr:TIGR02186 family protein [Thermodesulfatator indicus]AEH45916.1 hypothetical protein Thein_2066 [Thermodesulfatator indicus DSM 15286]
MMKRNKLLISIFIIGLFLLIVFPKAEAALSFKVTPNYIPIHFFYNGKDFEISGHTDYPADYIIVIKDKSEKLVLRRKGKVKGLFWMNVGEIAFEPVPIVYMVFSNKPIDKILNKEEQKKYAIGYNALFYGVKIEGVPENEREKWTREFIKFKEHLNLYRQKFNSIKVKNGKDGSDFVLKAYWPFQAPPDNYKVTVYAVKDGQIVESNTNIIKVQKVGLLKKITELAFKRPALYGIIAIVIAIMAGIGVGMIFGGKGSSKH